MRTRFSTAIPALCCALAAVLLAGCASVESTSVYYMPYTAKYYPPKPPDAPIPILGRKPPEPHTAIGRLAFSTDLGWEFLRKSMIYNARINGADAVVLRSTDRQDRTTFVQVPPRVDWVPSGGYYRTKSGRTYGYTSWVPFFQPGYVQPYVDTITTIDSEMIVFKK